MPPHIGLSEPRLQFNIWLKTAINSKYACRLRLVLTATRLDNGPYRNLSLAWITGIEIVYENRGELGAIRPRMIW